jgi:hypothetical protein
MTPMQVAGLFHNEVENPSGMVEDSDAAWDPDASPEVLRPKPGLRMTRFEKCWLHNNVAELNEGEWNT